MDKYYYILDPESPRTFLRGVFITSVLGSISGAVHAIRTRKSTFLFASQAGINSGLVGLTFFGIREYVISPVLTSTLSGPFHAQRRETINALKSNSPYDKSPISLSVLRSTNVVDTALSGAITGAIINVSRRGLPGLIPGLITMSLACTTVQVAWNELKIARIRLVSSLRGTENPFGTTSSDTRSTSEKILDRLGWIFPVKRISDEDYLIKLKAQREQALKRIKGLEDGLDTDKDDINKSSNA